MDIIFSFLGNKWAREKVFNKWEKVGGSGKIYFIFTTEAIKLYLPNNDVCIPGRI
jgi:hypothetical protein